MRKALFELAFALAALAIRAAFLLVCWNYLFTGETSILGRPLPSLDFWPAAVLALFGETFSKQKSLADHKP